MLIDLCNEEIGHKIKKVEKFDTLRELELRIKAYTKEAGFGIFVMAAKEKDKQNLRVCKCSKGLSKK